MLSDLDARFITKEEEKYIYKLAKNRQKKLIKPNIIRMRTYKY